LTCPRCGKVFRFREAPDKTAATPLPPRPSFADVPEAPVINPALVRHARSKKSWIRWVMGLAIAGALLGGAAAAWPWLRGTVVPWARELFQEEDKGPQGAVQVSKEFNYRFVFPERDWLDDPAARTGLKANFALHRTEPSAWLAVAYKDFKTRNPRSGEAVEEGVGRLMEYFGPDVEWEQQADQRLAGQSAQRLIFQGEVKGRLMRGDCTIVIYQGVAYWFIAWAPLGVWDQVQEEVQAVRGRFGLLRERAAWAEKRPPAKVFFGKGASYQLRDSEGIWQQVSNATDVDEAADMLLQGRDRKETLDVDKMAQVVVMILGRQNDLPGAVAAARAHLAKQQKKDYPESTFEVTSNAAGPEDGPATIGSLPGHLVKLRVRNGETRHRFIVLAVVLQPQGVLAIQCECAWERRRFWERDFSELLASFQEKAS
jgi:hypothetical protein